MRLMEKKLVAGLGLVTAILPATAAHACQGPLYETTTIIVTKMPREKILNGMTQLNIRISELQQKHNAGRRDYFIAEIINEDKGRPRVAILIPGTTSCGSVALPQAGDFFITGHFAKGGTLKNPMTIRGAAIFSPDFYTRRFMPSPPGVRD